MAEFDSCNNRLTNACVCSANSINATWPTMHSSFFWPRYIPNSSRIYFKFTCVTARSTSSSNFWHLRNGHNSQVECQNFCHFASDARDETPRNGASRNRRRHRHRPFDSPRKPPTIIGSIGTSTTAKWSRTRRRLEVKNDVLEIETDLLWCHRTFGDRRVVMG